MSSPLYNYKNILLQESSQGAAAGVQFPAKRGWWPERGHRFRSLEEFATGGLFPEWKKMEANPNDIKRAYAKLDRLLFGMKDRDRERQPGLAEPPARDAGYRDGIQGMTAVMESIFV